MSNEGFCTKTGPLSVKYVFLQDLRQVYQNQSEHHLMVHILHRSEWPGFAVYYVNLVFLKTWRPGIAVSVTQRHYVFKIITWYAKSRPTYQVYPQSLSDEQLSGWECCPKQDWKAFQPHTAWKLNLKHRHHQTPLHWTDKKSCQLKIINYTPYLRNIQSLTIAIVFELI